MLFRLASRSAAALALGVALSLTLSLTLARAPATAAEKPLVLEDFFRGKTVGKGAFESKIAGVYRPFTVHLTGSWNPKTFLFRLREDFVYDDGERDTKVWYFEKVAEGRYIGTRSDVRGPVNVSTSGGSLTFSYVADVPTEDGELMALRFRDTLTRTDRRTVRNTARVYRFGIPIGTVDLTFTR